MPYVVPILYIGHVHKMLMQENVYRTKKLFVGDNAKLWLWVRIYKRQCDINVEFFITWWKASTCGRGMPLIEDRWCG